MERRKNTSVGRRALEGAPRNDCYELGFCIPCLALLKSFHVQKNVCANVFVRVVANVQHCVQILDTVVATSVGRDYRRSLGSDSQQENEKEGKKEAHHFTVVGNVIFGLVARCEQRRESVLDGCIGLFLKCTQE